METYWPGQGIYHHYPDLPPYVTSPGFPVDWRGGWNHNGLESGHRDAFSYGWSRRYRDARRGKHWSPPGHLAKLGAVQTTVCVRLNRGYPETILDRVRLAVERQVLRSRYG